ncbi:redoxin domain-containing protein [Sunxiuqinia dokdonensis]|uniref:Thioredoxin peroxidase n=1 Tax=Sunxiuqinia dokdonensis TaxID=1409788 RepID=A0A0L8V7T8_9BACT|nr:redoxin domain-containing protein [Sunxiuqinia dokdonensis]KOH44247.1 peroxiredoxin [Sunxiuqinia dokdonensis]
MKTHALILVLLFFAIGTTYSQSNQIPLIGAKAPVFTAQTTNGELTFPNDFGESWKILFSHPKDFTPVCSSELLELAYLQKDLAMLNVKFAIISTDDLSQHNMWKAHLEELDYKGRGKQSIQFPIIDDSSKKVSITYGMLHTPTSTSRDIRGVYIIDPKNTVRSINFYPIEVGRNITEIERTILALQAADETNLLTPANWTTGDDLMVPHFPYTQKDLAKNPDLKNEYYNVGDRMWFKKVSK